MRKSFNEVCKNKSFKVTLKSLRLQYTREEDKLWHNYGEPQFGVVFSQKLCCGSGCGVRFPKVVVGVGVVVAKI